MTIIHLVEYYDVAGGLRTHLKKLIKKIKESGNTSIIVALQSQQSSGWDPNEPDILWIDGKMNSSLTNEYSILESKVFEIYEYINHKAISIVHAHSNYGYGIGVPLSYSLRCPCILTLHGCYPFFPLSRCMDCLNANDNLCESCAYMPDSDYILFKHYFLQHGITLRAAHNIIALNKETVNACITKYKISKNNVQIIKHWVDIPSELSLKNARLNIRKELGVKENELIILWVGANRPHKHFDVVVQTYQKMAVEFKHIKLLVVGLPYETFCREVNYLPSDMLGKVICLGTLDNDDLMKIYASADILLFPSTWESVSYVLLEAMASSLAIVAYDGLCNKDYLINGKNAYLVPLGDKEAFLIATKLLITNSRHRQLLGEQARNYIIKHHNEDDCFSMLYNIYVSTIQQY